MAKDSGKGAGVYKVAKKCFGSGSLLPDPDAENLKNPDPRSQILIL